MLWIFLQVQDVKILNENTGAVHFRGTSEDDIYVQAVTGLILDMLDPARQLPPPTFLLATIFLSDGYVLAL